MTESITVESKIDLKTYFAISLYRSFRTSLIVTVVVTWLILQFVFFYDQPFNLTIELAFSGALIVVYFGFIPLRIYFACRSNLKKIPYLTEGLTYTLSTEKIEYASSSVNASLTWQYITKVVEKSGFFLLLTPGKGMHYLPKNGFASENDMALFKDMVRHNNIRAYFK